GGLSLPVFPGRSPGDSERPLRLGRGGRRERLAAVHQRDRADAAPHHHLRRRHRPDWLVSNLRGALHPDRGRPTGHDPEHGDGAVSGGSRPAQLWLRLRDRYGAFRGLLLCLVGTDSLAGYVSGGLGRGGASPAGAGANAGALASDWNDPRSRRAPFGRDRLRLPVSLELGRLVQDRRGDDDLSSDLDSHPTSLGQLFWTL